MLRKQPRSRKQSDNETSRVIDQRGAAREFRVYVFSLQIEQLQHALRADFIDDFTGQRRHQFQLRHIVRHFRRHLMKVRPHRFAQRRRVP
jgi:hypothetical protein